MSEHHLPTAKVRRDGLPEHRADRVSLPDFTDVSVLAVAADTVLQCKVCVGQYCYVFLKWLSLLSAGSYGFVGCKQAKEDG